MKLGTLVKQQRSINKIVKAKFTNRSSWKLSKLLKNAVIEISAFEVLRNNKILSYGEIVKDENGKDTDNTKVKTENEEVYRNEIMELLTKDIEIDIPLIEMKEIIEYNKKLEKKIDMQLEDLLLLDWLLK